MKYKLLFVSILLAMTLQLSACATNPNDSSSTNSNSISQTTIALEVKESLADDKIDKSIPRVKTQPINMDGYSVAITGVSFTKSTGNPVTDSLILSLGLDSNYFKSIDLGFDIGHKTSSDKEVSKRNAYVSLFFEYGLPENASQRDSVVPKFEINLQDNKGDKLILMYDSMKDKYINIDYPYGMMIFKAYDDAEYVVVNINDTNYKVNIADLVEQNPTPMAAAKE